MPGHFGMTYTRNMRPTGKIRFVERRHWWRIFIVPSIEIEWESQYRQAPAIHPLPEAGWVRKTRWRDAEALDMAEPALRWVIDGKKDI